MRRIVSNGGFATAVSQIPEHISWWQIIHLLWLLLSVLNRMRYKKKLIEHRHNNISCDHLYINLILNYVYVYG